MTFKALAVTVAALSLVLLSSCSGDDESAPETLNTQFDTPILAGEGGPRYEEPVPITSGDYWSASINVEDVVDRTNNVEARQGSPFSGTVAGIRLIPTAEVKASDRPNSCNVANFEQTIHFEFTYLPPGTSAQTPQYVARCADGRLNFVVQEFITKHGIFVVNFDATDLVLIYDAPEERVHTIKVNGGEALAVDPPVPEGVGSSLVALITANGYLFASGAGLPISELVDVLEGIKCADC